MTSPTSSEAKQVDLLIERVNASLIRVHTADKGIREDLYQFFQYSEPGFQKNRFTKWDGTHRLFKKSTGDLPYGVLKMLLSLCRDRGYSFELDDTFKEDIAKVTMSDLKSWVKELDLPVEPYDYQMQMLHDGVKYNRMTFLAATSAGKSLAIYMLVRYYEMLNAQDGLKTLVLVPSINLVSQMHGDFKDYSQRNKWNAQLMCHQICEGAAKESNKPVFISTWQSIQKMPAEYFHQFGRVIIDETHLASGDSIRYIGMNCINAYQRVGLTGTLRNDKINPVLVQSVLGPVKKIVSARELIDAGRATRTDIKMVQLDYGRNDRKFVHDMAPEYAKEIDFLIAHQERNKVIKNMARGLKGNSLFLFDRVEGHLEPVYEQLVAENDQGRTYFKISGEVDNETRDRIKKAIEAGNDIVLLSTFGCSSTGVSIKKLHNLVLCHPTKSNVRLLQSLGRLLRLHESKDVATIYDLVDDIEYQGRKNFAWKHGIERFRIYQEEGHPVKVMKYPIGNGSDAYNLFHAVC
mgnify:CR=1 FL=1